MKARSRLKATPEEKVATHSPIQASSHHQTTASFSPSPRSRPPVSSRSLPFDTSAYTTHIGTLFLGLVFSFLTIVIMRTWRPSSMADWLLPHTYVPFQVVLFLSTFFLSSFLWLNSRRGYLTALALQTLVFLKLQKIELSWPLILGIVSLFVIIEVVFSYFVSRNYATFHQKSYTRHRRTRP